MLVYILPNVGVGMSAAIPHSHPAPAGWTAGEGKGSLSGGSGVRSHGRGNQQRGKSHVAPPVGCTIEPL